MRVMAELSRIVVVVLVSISIGAILGYYSEFTESALYQTLTAVIECLAILLGLFGVFAAFRLELQERDLREATHALNIVYDTSLKPPSEVYEKGKEMMEKKRMPSGLTNEGVKHVQKWLNELHRSIKKKNDLKEMIRFPLVCITILLVASLMALPIIGLFARSITTALIIGIVGFSVYTVYSTVDSLEKFIFG